MADDTRSKLDTDESGNIIMHPVTAYTTAIMAETYIFLALEYASDPEGPDKGKGGRTQLSLTPPQSLEIAEKLTTLANRVLRPSTGTAPN